MTAPSISGPTILVAEMDEEARALLRAAFEHASFVVLLAGSGEAAVNLYESAHASVDVVLLSAQRPGLNGRRVLAALQEINTAVRCVIATALTPQDEVLPLVRQGAAGLLAKPLVLDEAVRVVRQAVEAGRGKGPPAAARAQPRPAS
jgi:two-component system NtrC family sensor kinase